MKESPLEYLLGHHKSELIKFCLKHKIFYQREVMKELGWTYGTTQYHLRQFVKHGLLTEIQTSTKTYYKINKVGFPRMFL